MGAISAINAINDDQNMREILREIYRLEEALILEGLSEESQNERIDHLNRQLEEKNAEIRALKKDVAYVSKLVRAHEAALKDLEDTKRDLGFVTGILRLAIIAARDGDDNAVRRILLQHADKV